MKTQLPELKSDLSKEEREKLGHAIGFFESADMDQLIVDTALGYTTRATLQEPTELDSDGWEREIYGHKLVLEFLLLIKDLKRSRNGLLSGVIN